jgi:serine/threonine-protein kinase
MTDLAERLSGAIAGRYRVGKELGRGQAATVFEGEDLRHGRMVALKVLHPEFAAAIGADRFRREIDIVAKLTHPHILTLIDSGEADGLLYFVMPLVDGQSMRELLDREGRLPIDRALAFMDQIASAITHAHENGVVHRDLKPANILISGDQAVVADFGIAQLTPEAGSARLTRTGMVVGTPAYMSPEQAVGDERIDGRSDVYSLGCLLFEMLTGAPPFEATSFQALIACHLLDTAPALTELVPEAPVYLERAVARAMAKSPSDRFRTARSFVETIRSETVVEAITNTRLAVLPPAESGTPAEGDVLAQGLHEALISRLGRGPVAVLSRTSVLPLVEAGRSLADICKELSVDAILESSLLRVGDRVQVDARLVDATTEESLWSGSFDGNATDVFAFHKAITASVATGVLDTLAPRARIRSAAAPADPAAYERYMRGRIHQQGFTPDDLEKAQQYYESALTFDPDFAAPHAGIALVWGSKSVLGLAPPKEAGEQWGHHAVRAIQLDPEWAEGHQALAQKYTWYDFDWERAETSYARAIALDPMEPQARNFYAHFLAIHHRAKESEEQILESVAIDPLNPFTQMFRAIQLGLTGRHPASIDAFGAVPPNPLRSFALSWQHFMLGDMPAGLAHYTEYFRMLGDEQVVAALSDGESGPREAMTRGAKVLAQRAEQMFVKPNNIIHLFGWGGDIDEAMAWIERAYAIHEHELAYMSVMGSSRELRDDPRFHVFMERMSLPHPDGVSPP